MQGSSDRANFGRDMFENFFYEFIGVRLFKINEKSSGNFTSIIYIIEFMIKILKKAKKEAEEKAKREAEEQSRKEGGTKAAEYKA